MIQLQCDGATAVIAKRGAELLSFRTGDGREYIWRGEEGMWQGHSPVLFPAVGRCMDGQVKIAGKAYQMPMHGIARDEDFQLVERGGGFVVFALEANDRTLAHYPFPFRLTVRHTICGNGFTTQFAVTNPGDTDLPYCIGGHPGFTCPLERDARFEDYDLCFAEKETGENTLVTAEGYMQGKEILPALQQGDTLPLSYDLFTVRDTLVLEGIHSKEVRLLHRGTGRGLSFSFTGFDLLAIWTAAKQRAPFLCLEPWSGLPAVVGESGNFEDKPYLRWLAPGETDAKEYHMEGVR